MTKLIGSTMFILAIGPIFWASFRTSNQTQKEQSWNHAFAFLTFFCVAWLLLISGLVGWYRSLGFFLFALGMISSFCASDLHKETRSLKFSLSGWAYTLCFIFFSAFLSLVVFGFTLNKVELYTAVRELIPLGIMLMYRNAVAMYGIYKNKDLLR